MAKPILFVLAAISLVIAGFYYRGDNAKQAKILADKLVAVDLAGTDPTQASTDLKDYVSSHTGATVTYTLQGAFNRAEAAAKAAAAATAANSQIYADAQKACMGKSDSITQARCNQDYLAKHLVNVPAPATVTAPKLADFKHTEKAPPWTPDLPGALFLGAVAALGFAVYSLPRRRRRR